MDILIITGKVLKLNHYLIINKSYFNIMAFKTFEEISVELKKRVENLEISVDNLMIILQDVLEVVELTKAKGPQKKAFAISLLKQIVSEADIDESERENCNLIINNGTISNTIDLVITASKKKTKLNKKKGIMNRLSKNTIKAMNLQRRYGNLKRRSIEKK
tara:strand:- start:1790 stop:2272 length:483 start_codon:yes stop_codon:yes gene_type:complete